MLTLQKIKSDQKVVCPLCEHEDLLANCFTFIPVDGKIEEYGVMCHACNHFVHSYYMTEGLKLRTYKMKVAAENMRANPGKKTQTEYNTQKQSFDRAFKKTQTKLRRKFNLPLEKIIVWDMNERETNAEVGEERE